MVLIIYDIFIIYMAILAVYNGYMSNLFAYYNILCYYEFVCNILGV